jgi:geranylgeranyl pyrophosphate synthase
MIKGGKRWRPLLAVGVYRALSQRAELSSGTLQRLAVAVECFHKASLIHDDIEDEDASRYGEQTLYRQYGVAVALNVGDLLIGEGYRLIAESGASSDQVCEMMTVAAMGHRTLCLGQGEELLLRKAPEGGTVPAVLEILRRKTAPAFDVALQLGAIGAKGDQETRTVLSDFSNAIGIAYQIRDDLDDHTADGQASASSVLTALARERSGEGLNPVTAEERARELLKHYENEALRALRPLRHTALKCLLYRVATLLLHPSPP